MDPAPTKREQILQATLDLIREKGLNELTTAKIARRSGTAETIIYRHFASKHEIISELLTRVSRDFQKDAELIQNESISPIEKLAKLSANHLAFIERTQGISRILFSEQIHLADSRDPLKLTARKLDVEYRSCVKQIIIDGKNEGVFTADLDEETASRSFMGLHYLLLHEWSLDDFSWNLSQMNETVITYYTRAWAPAPNPKL